MGLRAPQEYLIPHPTLGIGEGNNGFFRISRGGVIFNIQCSDGMGWEHVSVSIHNKNRCPTWDEMCMIKDIFWSKDDVVVQYHPAKSQYVNIHQYCLHLWKPIGVDMPTPFKIMVGM